MSDFMGQTIGRYQLLEKLGQGGMAVVYKAYDTRLDREVAIKFIRMELVGSAYTSEVLRRFEREAKALARLTHPNIVHVHDYGEHAGTPYLVMEYLGGGTLKDRLSGQPMPYKDAARLLLPVAHSLEYAHANSIIHRDIKPANILLTQYGQPMLSDFGIAKILDAGDATALTGTGLGIGTPEYMSPEQGQGRKDIDQRTDIYALGVVYYEMITGHKPFQADTPMAVILKHMSEPLPRPKIFVPDLPDEVEHFIFRSLAKAPENRCQDMVTFAHELEKIAFTPSSLPAPIPAPGQPQPQPIQDTTGANSTGTRTRTSPMGQAVSGAVPTKAVPPPSIHAPAVPPGAPSAPSEVKPTTPASKPVSRRVFIIGGVMTGIAAIAACGGLAVVGLNRLSKLRYTPTSEPSRTPRPTKEPATESIPPSQAPTEAATGTATAAPTAQPTGTPTTVPTAAPRAGGILIVGRSYEPEILDSAASAYDLDAWRVASEILDTLTHLEGTSTKVIAWLAESWYSPDGKVWTFKLRKDVKFHDGTPLDAEAVAWNIERWRNKDNSFRFNRAFEAYDAEFGETYAITAVKVVDPVTVEITLANPTAVILSKLQLAAFGISSPTAIKAQGDRYGTPVGNTVGCGPFMFKEWAPNDRIVLERNPNWWGEGPELEGIIFRTIPDDAARLLALQAGEVHQADLGQADGDTAETDPNIVTYILPSITTGYISFQQCIKPFDNVDVRWAVAHAINREALLKTFYPSRDEVAKCFQPPAIFGSNPDIGPIEYSVEKAKERLAKAGLANGFKTEFWYRSVYRMYAPDPQGIAEAIANDLAKVGISVEPKTEANAAFNTDFRKGIFPLWILGWTSDYGDPDNYIGWHFSHPVGQPKEEDCYNNNELVQLLSDGAKEIDLAKREQIYKQAEQIVHDDMARLPVVWPAGRIFFSKKVKGYHPVLFRSWYEKIWIEG